MRRARRGVGSVEVPGRGTVGGFPEGAVTFKGIYDGEEGTFFADYAMDTEQKIHPDHLTVYAVELERR